MEQPIAGPRPEGRPGDRGVRFGDPGGSDAGDATSSGANASSMP